MQKPDTFVDFMIDKAVKDSAELERITSERNHFKSEADNLRGLWNDPRSVALRAAAPDLLAVCEKILSDDDEVELLADETVEALKAAVAKAKR
jgi:hypothetical protein